MATVTLRDLYAAELHDLMNAEKQILAELPVMAGRATSSQLRRAFDDHHAETKVQIDRLRLLIAQLNDHAQRVPSGAAAALIEDARRRLADAERGEVLDAALIAAAQRIEHYEIASYATARSYAESLGHYGAARILQQTLDEEGHTDHALTKLAERGINQGASEDLVEDSTRDRSRLRYIAAKELPGASEEGDLHLHNHDGEHLGVLDGFIVDSQSGQPIYYVIDSRGWFAGRRYVVPVGQIEPYEGASALQTALTRKELARYPEFSPSAFLAMDNHDAARYERRLHRAFAHDSQPNDARFAYGNLPNFGTPTWFATDISESGVPNPEYRVPNPETRDSNDETRTPNPESHASNPESRIPGPESELMMAREPEDRAKAEQSVPGGGDMNPRSTEQPKTTDPRIERYRDR